MICEAVATQDQLEGFMVGAGPNPGLFSAGLVGLASKYVGNKRRQGVTLLLMILLFLAYAWL